MFLSSVKYHEYGILARKNYHRSFFYINFAAIFILFLMRDHKYIIISALVVLLTGTAIFALAMLQHRDTSQSVLKQVAKQVEQKKAEQKKVEPKKVQAKADTLAPPDPTVRGVIKDTEGKPMEGVVVSDGFTCTKTNSNGLYIFMRNKNARFVFYTVPADCEIPVHSDSDRTAMIYKPLSVKRNVYDFTLKRLPGGKELNYRLIVFGDPQVTNAFSPYYTGPNDNPVKKSDVARFTDETMRDVKTTIASWPAGTHVYAISMGDDVQYYGGYNPKLEGEIRKALGSSKARVFSVIGNHDQDGKELYERKWEASFGPTDYSFDRGNVHYVCFNNVHFANKSYWQPGELTSSQMEWLKEDLQLADHMKKVILCYHIPFTFGNRPYKGAHSLNLESEPNHFSSSVLSRVLRMVETFKGGFELFCGHTHFAINHEIEYEGRHLLEHCHAAACGNIWQSNINICGTPNGYYVYYINGTRISDSYYKGTFWPRDKQMSLFRANTVFNGESYADDWKLPENDGVIVANVFNADSRWKVVAIEDGVEHAMTRINHQGQDAFATGYHHRYSQSVSYWFISKKNGYLIMNHLYYYKPKSPESPITVRATDPYGHTYTASSNDAVTEPFYNYAHYYK